MVITKANDFIEAYMKSGRSAKQTANFLNTTPAVVKQRVKSYRERGIKLPTPTDQRNGRLDIDALNTLIKSLKG